MEHAGVEIKDGGGDGFVVELDGSDKAVLFVEMEQTLFAAERDVETAFFAKDAFIEKFADELGGGALADVGEGVDACAGNGTEAPDDGGDDLFVPLNDRVYMVHREQGRAHGR